MSQGEVYRILEELGGEATTRQIRDRAKEKFPDLSLHTYVTDRLKKLRKKGYITRALDRNGNVLWKIVEKYPR